MVADPVSSSGLSVLVEGHYLETLSLIPALTLLVFMAFIIRVDRYIRPELKRTMQFILLALFSLVAQNYLEYRLAEGEVKWLARTLTSIYGYAIRPMILILFLRVIAPDQRLLWAWGLVGVNAAINATALFSHICFWINDRNEFHRGPLGNTCLYVSGILLLCLFAMTIRVFRPHRRKETWVPILVLVLIAGALVLDSNVGHLSQPITYLTIACIIGSLAYYTWLHLQFVREHEQALRAEQRIQIMMTQIQPHFLYNTIATIRALCRRDADKAGEVAERFGDYLRQNLDSLGIAGLIPFEKELDHTRIYAEIEMVRFENIRLEYDIQDERFELPPLTLQPLVENAIRHGVRIREEGVVRVMSRRAGTCHEIQVRDNGAGFDVSRLDAADGSHIGLSNVRERLETMCGGTLTIDSTVGEGTTVTISIPIRKEAEP